MSPEKTAGFRNWGFRGVIFLHRVPLRGRIAHEEGTWTARGMRETGETSQNVNIQECVSLYNGMNETDG